MTTLTLKEERKERVRKKTWSARKNCYKTHQELNDVINNKKGKMHFSYFVKPFHSTYTLFLTLIECIR